MALQTTEIVVLGVISLIFIHRFIFGFITLLSLAIPQVVNACSLAYRLLTNQLPATHSHAEIPLCKPQLPRYSVERSPSILPGSSDPIMFVLALLVVGATLYFLNKLTDGAPRSVSQQSRGSELVGVVRTNVDASIRSANAGPHSVQSTAALGTSVCSNVLDLLKAKQFMTAIEVLQQSLKAFENISNEFDHASMSSPHHFSGHRSLLPGLDLSKLETASTTSKTSMGSGIGRTPRLGLAAITSKSTPGLRHRIGQDANQNAPSEQTIALTEAE
eukprot:c12236_g1_i3.p1 GENE.c12236_g1_i3~~c12236_g1_i3.p1  ORF type:complete len:274 (+),score=65.34 c12236_g1_i3:130-951(+)